ncbi:MAG: hotdog fold thioesterase [Flavobacteriales bacterium]
MLWFKPYTLQDLDEFVPNTIMEHIGIEITELTDTSISGTMPVDKRTHQPAGILHGGASVVLAETLGSLASVLVLDRSKNICVGLEINANHIRPISSGKVTGTATAIHIGGKTHIWEIKIVSDKGKLICISRLTMAILPK